ncbi:SusD/RagB family nutrient-binding outer membrane lipoprotein [Marinifilum sp.]|uniref:SusD/RagB family nutrient-binding outer membrane lipoprotein n=1 Tax=Marinifilum sp. TaxID=2033137 RepID=UPI003BAAAB99
MKKILYKIFAFIIVYAGVISCSDYLDINQDPDNPEEATILDIMPVAQASSAFAISQDFNRVGSDVVQYFVGRHDAWTVTPATASNTWRFTLYAGALKDLETIIEKGTESEDYHFVGIAKLLKAYCFNHMVDLWDDIPYTEALNDDIESPVFDDGAAIYDNLFTLIDEAILDLGKTNTISLSEVDFIYGGNVAAWIRMGNTLKLKMYLQLRHVDTARAKAGIEQLVAAEQSAPGTVLITSASQDFNFYYGTSTAPENRNPGFKADYVTKGEAYVNTFFYTFMTDNNDPRVPYYFFLQGDDFEGRVEGDPAPTGNDAGTRSVQGIYPCGGKYDDGSGGSVSGSSADGDGEFRMLTSFMNLFMQAEAALSINATVSSDARTLFENAIRLSFAEVNALSAPSIAAADIDTYVAARLATYDATTTNEEKIELVIEERWISQFGNGLESYSDLRRTGYPDLPAPVQTNNVFPNRFPYPDTELSSNPNAPEQPENNVKVFWMQ